MLGTPEKGVSCRYRAVLNVGFQDCPIEDPATTKVAFRRLFYKTRSGGLLRQEAG